MNTKILWSVIVALLVIGAVAWSMNRPDDSMMESEIRLTDDEAMIEQADDEAMMEDGDEVGDNEEQSDDTEVDSGGTYRDYSAETLAAEQAADNTVVLFFHATWCPYCQAADVAFKTQTDEIPAGVTVLKVDYDSNTELKTKYGVTTQHTFVQIDADGEQVTKWVSGDTAELQANLK